MPKNITNITGVSLCQKTGIIRIFRSTIKELGDPKYISKDWDFKICSVQMLRMIWKVCGWNENDTYRAAGIHYPEYNLVEFNLNQADIVQFGQIE